jgi:GxxExxY protein
MAKYYFEVLELILYFEIKKYATKSPSAADTKFHHNKFIPVSQELDNIAKKIVDSAYTVHKNLGPGLLEKVYEICFCHELTKRGLHFQRQVDIPVVYDGLIFNEGLRLDVIVENEIICELKALEIINPLWEAQVLSHLKLTEKRLGFLINFNVINIGDGIKRLVL